MIIHYPLCADEAVTRVAVIDTTDQPVIGTEDDLVYWEIVAPVGSRETSWTVGETPPGFREEVALRESLPTGRDLAALVDGTSVQTVGHFEVGDLRADLILLGEEHLTEEQFLERALETCP